MDVVSTDSRIDRQPWIEPSLDARELEPDTDNEPKRQVWRRLEEIEDERRLRDELADWDDFAVEN